MFAYIDPGVGLLIWQATVATFVGLLFYLKKTRNWIIGFVWKVFRREQKRPDVGGEAPGREG